MEKERNPARVAFAGSFESFPFLMSLSEPFSTGWFFLRRIDELRSF
jgi:hypothetical protein